MKRDYKWRSVQKVSPSQSRREDHKNEGKVASRKMWSTCLWAPGRIKNGAVRSGVEKEKKNTLGLDVSEHADK